MDGRCRGFSLLELLLALSVLAIAILAFVQLQAVSLQNTALARALADTTRVVRSEIDFRRSTNVLYDEEFVEIAVGDDSLVLIELEEESDIFASEVDCRESGPGVNECDVWVSACDFVIGGEGITSQVTCDLDIDHVFDGTLFTFVRVTGVGNRGDILALPSISTGIFVVGIRAE